MVEKICQDCGCKYEAKSEKSRFCPNCIKKRRMAARKRYATKNRLAYAISAVNKSVKSSIKKEQPKKKSICDSFCRDCIYVLGGQSGLKTCDYFAKADKLRPCPAGSGCTVKKTLAQYNAEQRAKAKENPKTWIVKCGICGKEFETKDKRRKNCSKECLLISRRNASKAQSERLKEARHGKETKPTAGGV